MRQSEDDTFLGILQRIRIGEITDEDEKLLSSRNAENLSKEELEEFGREGTYLFGEKILAERYKNFRLERLGSPIVEIVSKDSRYTPVGFEHKLRLAVGAKCALTMNLYVEVSLKISF